MPAEADHTSSKAHDTKHHEEAVLPPVVVVVGPTASGKSAAALRIAVQMRDESTNQPDAVPITPHLINADVSQMYPGLPIATNKPLDTSDHQGVPHHFIGHLNDCEQYTVHRFVADTLSLMRDLRRKEPRPLFVICGGTHYYVQGLLIGNELAAGGGGGGRTSSSSTTAVAMESHAGEEDANDAAVYRRRVEATARGGSEESRWDVLHRIDPAMARRWHPNDVQRIDRCIQLYVRTGALPSSTELDRGRPALRPEMHPSIVLWIDTPRDVLEHKIKRRCWAMVERGIVEEVRQYSQRWGAVNCTTPRTTTTTTEAEPPQAAATAEDVVPQPFLMRAIGFKEFLPLLEVLQRRPPDSSTTTTFVNGSSTDSSSSPPPSAADERAAALRLSVETLAMNTRRYALQQDQWLRNRFMNRYSAALHPNFYRVDGSRPDAAENAVRVARAAIFDSTNATLYAPPPGVVRVAPIDAAGEDATAKSGAADGADLSTRRCDACQMTLCGARQWQQHLGTRRHRKATTIRPAARRRPRAEQQGLEHQTAQATAAEKGDQDIEVEQDGGG